ncbi:LCP family protein [Cytobacillus firmus]|uniref:LCP family protein n=1 Tax=Cytobacillus firmus TaxID=1399 RepID=UPI0021624150|nr:LCP family protein [Cytobacillus firmus]MCS0654753.1 LCP family protein [Cytobacillus firmus]MCU1807074.1 LCP family protein [Cytobacillus firmus]
MRRVFAILTIIVLTLTSIAAYFVYKTTVAANSSYDELERGEKSKLRDTAIEVHKDPFSVLLIGVEDYASGGNGGRADTLIVATFDPEDKTIKLLSIPRDTMVEIADSREMDKINHSFNGGKQNTVETVENFLNIPIDYYATVNFEAFKNTIDLLGGITVNVPFDFWEKSDVTNEKIYFTEGEMQLNGEESLAYARMRKRDPMGDFGRNERQKDIIKAIIEKAISPSTVFKIDDLTKEIGKNVETNLRTTEGVKIFQLYSDFNISDIETLKIEGENSTIDSIYYFIPNEDSIQSIQDTLLTHLKQEKALVSEDNYYEEEM